MPGLPLSVLDHNLVVGNALIGIGSIDEIRAPFEAAGTSLFPVDAEQSARAGGAAARPAREPRGCDDKGRRKARDAMAEARALVGDTQALCDIIRRRGSSSIEYQFEHWEQGTAARAAIPARHKRRGAQGLRPFISRSRFPRSSSAVARVSM